MAELPELLLPDATAWREWLAEHHDSSPGVRLFLHKKGGNVTELDYAAALDEALCYGWIDGVVGKRDDHSFVRRFTPRTKASKWSKINVGHFERLSEEGRMRPAGVAAADAAKADGRWEAAYSGQASIEMPADFAAAIAASPRARAMFEVLTATNRYAFLYRIANVKTEAARKANIARFVAMMESGETPYPQKRRPAADS
ncbi:YdeI/OmpD-associated family protein [Arthrobacter sp. HY1533]|uniref:YdeI/OmpD-associated family protein n=1 Tax=Arthrobacter sp. HY1533 TaxID=2970919 RepID=UPI0022B9DE11|nr:YdeI/OmpD-associated family protein [Arthrobacter sp. HY1533]